jgi:hypothetical protein
MKNFQSFVAEAKSVCPPVTHNLAQNLINRQHAIDNYGYGPMNPMEPSLDFWKAKAKMWKVTIEYAQKARCCTCAAFNVSDQIRQCIVDGISDSKDDMAAIEGVINKADLGYCELLDFKCAGSRTCDAWLTNGPLDNKDIK